MRPEGDIWATTFDPTETALVVAGQKAVLNAHEFRSRHQSLMSYRSIGIGLLLQVCLIYLPPLQALFASAALDGRAWLYAMATGSIVLPLISLDKWTRNRF